MSILVVQSLCSGKKRTYEATVGGKTNPPSPGPFKGYYIYIYMHIYIYIYICGANKVLFFICSII